MRRQRKGMGIMRFRPCIDIHNGKVKQIVGGSLQDAGNLAEDNYVSEYDGGFYADLYRRDGLRGGHIIILNREGTRYYEEDVAQARKALKEFPGGLQVGGGIHQENAEFFLDLGATHVIVTSYVFRQGRVDYDRLEALSRQIGREHLVLDLSCRLAGEDYYIVTDRWQKVTEEPMTRDTLEKLSGYCDEFLIHAVDVEGKASGVEREVVRRLGAYDGLPVTYAGGIHSLEDICWIEAAGKGHVDYTVGSALDLFGGKIPYRKLISENVTELL